MRGKRRTLDTRAAVPRSTQDGRGLTTAIDPDQLAAAVALAASHSRWEPLANGIVAAPERVFNLGDVVMVQMFF